MRSLVMSDAETNTEWSHLLGRAMAGPLKSKTLEPIVSDMLTWAAWLEEHPETTVLAMSRTAQMFTRDVYREPNQYVYGFELGGKSHYISMKRLLEAPTVSVTLQQQPLVFALDRRGSVVRLFEAKTKDTTLTFEAIDERRMRDNQTGSVWSRISGESIEGELAGTKLKQRVGIMSFRKAWMNFHPNTSELEP